jgi:hypothetical protein
MIDKPLAYRQVRGPAGELVAVFDVSRSDGALHVRYDEAERTLEGDDAGMATYAWHAESLADLRELLLRKFTGTALERDARAVFDEVAAAVQVA